MRSLTVALVVVGLATPALAQSRREMQMMADIRMLQEQNQQLQVELQAAVAALTEALKAINERAEEQAAATRKGFADQMLKVDQFATELRVVREGVSENNVRIAQLSQEIEALRLSIPQYPGGAVPGAVDPNAPPPDPNAPTPAPGAAGAPGDTLPPAPAPLGPGMSPQRLYDTALADYYAGQYDLCVSGFDTYLRTFPRSELAHQAQWYIGECHANAKEWQEAIDAYNQVITNHPKSASAPNAYFKRGRAFEELGQRDRAIESYEAAIKNFPDSDAARLAKQSLDRLKRGKPE